MLFSTSTFQINFFSEQLYVPALEIKQNCRKSFSVGIKILISCINEYLFL